MKKYTKTFYCIYKIYQTKDKQLIYIDNSITNAKKILKFERKYNKEGCSFMFETNKVEYYKEEGKIGAHLESHPIFYWGIIL